MESTVEHGRSVVLPSTVVCTVSDVLAKDQSSEKWNQVKQSAVKKEPGTENEALPVVGLHSSALVLPPVVVKSEEANGRTQVASGHCIPGVASTVASGGNAIAMTTPLLSPLIAGLAPAKSISESPACVSLLHERRLHPPTASLTSSPGMASEVEDGSDTNDSESSGSEDQPMDTEDLAMQSPGAHQSVACGGAEADEDEEDEDDDEEDEEDDDGDDDDALLSLAPGGDGISQLLQAAEADLTPGIEMLAAAAQNATPAGFPCTHCNKTYPMASALRRHIKRSHTKAVGANGNPFAAGGHGNEKKQAKCSFCLVDLPQPATQAVRRQHMRGECPKNPYACQQCDKVFVSPGGLQRHSLLHNGKRPFQCTICSKEFTQASHLKVHMNGHTGEKPYQCDYEDCGKTYSDPSSLRSHKLAHAGIKSKKKRNPDAPYLANPKCAYCDKRFVSRATRDQHARECSNNPYRCMICQKACLGMVKLERHIRSHSRSRVSSLKAQELAKNKKTQSPDPKCAYCTERFPTRVVRDRHSRMCVNNPYRCNLCSKAFLGSAKLLRHARSHAETNTHGSAAVAAAIDHAASLAAADPGPASPTSAQDSSSESGSKPVSADLDAGKDDSVTASAEDNVLPSVMPSAGGLPILPPTVSTASLGNIMMPPGSHPVIAVQTPLGYSFMPNPFSTMGSHLPLLTAAQQQLQMQNSMQTLAEANGLGQNGSTAGASGSPNEGRAEEPATVSESTVPQPTGSSSGEMSKDSGNSVQPSSLVTGSGAPQQATHSNQLPAAEDSLSAGHFSSMMSDIKMEPSSSEHNLSQTISLMPTIPPASLPGVNPASAITSQAPAQTQVPTFLASIPTPFNCPFPFAAASGSSRSHLSGTSHVNPLEAVPNFLQAVLGGGDSLNGQSAAVLQQMTQVMQMQAGLLQQSSPATQSNQTSQEESANQPARVDSGRLVKQEPIDDSCTTTEASAQDNVKAVVADHASGQSEFTTETSGAES